MLTPRRCKNAVALRERQRVVPRLYLHVSSVDVLICKSNFQIGKVAQSGRCATLRFLTISLQRKWSSLSSFPQNRLGLGVFISPNSLMFNLPIVAYLSSNFSPKLSPHTGKVKGGFDYTIGS